MATIQQVVDYNRDNVNWVKFFSVVDTLGKTMNGPKDRFDKSDIIEMALDIFSNGNIQRVDMVGCDHLLTNLPNSDGTPTTQEMKFVTELFYKEYVVKQGKKKTKVLQSIANYKLKKTNKNTGLPTVHTITLKLMNSLGKNTHKTLPATYAEFLLVADSNSIHVIKTTDLVPYLKFGDDGIEAKNVPSTLFHEVVGPPDLVGRKALANSNYKELKIAFQRHFLSQF